MGVVMLTLGVMAAVLMIIQGSPRIWRLLLAAPFFLAALGFFQSREKTCVVLAVRNTQNMDAGEKKVTDENAARLLRGKAIRIALFSLLVSCAAVFAMMLF